MDRLLFRATATLSLMAAFVVGVAAEPGWLKTVVEPGASGLPTRIGASEKGLANLLVAPVEFRLSEDRKELASPKLAKAGAQTWAGEVTEAGLRVELTYGVGTTGFVELRVSNLTDKARTVTATLALPVVPEADRAFFPAGDRPHVTLAADQPAVNYGYQAGGQWTAMPLAQVYDGRGDRGLAVFGEIGALVEPMTTAVSRSAKATRVEVGLPLPLSAKGQAVRRVYFVATRGDWRPALGAVLAAFPKAFEPQHPDVAALQGPFVCSGGTPDNAEIERWHDQGCRVVEVHCTFPFYGDYVPTREVWTPLVDDTWHSLKQSVPADQRPPDDASWQAIRDFVEQRNPPSMTRAAVNDYLDRLHRHGMKGLIYFNPTEAWAPWAAATFRDDRILGAGGKPIPAWYESSAMVPDKGRPWGKYLLEQIKGELAIYPQVDGVFFDQSAGGGHDLTELCAEGAKMVRAKGGLCWWNGPYNMELAALADGMMTEGGGSETYRQPTEVIQYYGLAGKPIVSLGAATSAGYAEMLIHGVIPTPVSRAQSDMGERWFPLFRWLRNRRWVLEAHALEAPTGINANLYRTPEGNLVLPIVRSQVAEGEARPLLDLGFTVRAPEVRDVRGAYLLTPDLLGYHKLPFTRTGDSLQVTLPRLETAALLVLAKSGVFPAVDGRLHVVVGAEKPVRLTFDNWTPKPVELSLKQGAKTVAAGASATMDCPVTVNAEGPRVTIASPGKLDGSDIGPFELRVESPLVLLAEGPAEVRDDARLTVTATLLSHVANVPRVRLGATGEGWQFGAASEVTLTPERATRVALTGRPTRAGETTVEVQATWPGSEALAKVSVQVLATAIAPGGFEKVRAAELQMDVFGVDAGPYEHKPVLLNGVEVGNLPQGSGDMWATGKALALPAAALKALREHNGITIDNTVGDSFKVRNLRLLLHLRGGVTAVSSVDEGVYCSSKGWPFDEGTSFDTGQPLTGMKVDVRVDPNRRERYEEFFGTPKSGKLVIEVNGSDGGVRAHKPVSVNGFSIGDLPQAGDWTEETMPLTAEALNALMTRNEVVIENSEPADAFKVRRARIEIENTEGRTFTTGTDADAYTSVGWELAEGKVGSPIRIALSFPRP